MAGHEYGAMGEAHGRGKPVGLPSSSALIVWGENALSRQVFQRKEDTGVGSTGLQRMSTVTALASLA